MARVIKKYPNRRLYDTETSAYITLAEIKQFVLSQEAFVVQDARSGEDLTRSILLQVILEEESGGVPMFTADMLANIIRYYGHSMQGLMGSYLERSIGAFHEAQKKFQEQSSTLYGAAPAFKPDAWVQMVPGLTGIGAAGAGNALGDFIEKGTSSVIGMQEELRKQAMQMFSAFPYAAPGGNTQSAANDAKNDGKNDPSSSAKAGKPAPKRKKKAS